MENLEQKRVEAFNEFTLAKKGGKKAAIAAAEAVLKSVSRELTAAKMAAQPKIEGMDTLTQKALASAELRVECETTLELGLTSEVLWGMFLKETAPKPAQIGAD